MNRTEYMPGKGLRRYYYHLSSLANTKPFHKHRRKSSQRGHLPAGALKTSHNGREPLDKCGRTTMIKAFKETSV